jgi:outer membrane protein OmpA-like peptidoglycan-associated protein
VTRQGLDIFFFKNGQIKSIGAPLNTSGDDFSLVSLSNDSVVFSQSKSNGEAYSVDLVLAWVNSSEGYSRPESSTNSIVKIKLNDNSEEDQILEKLAQLDERLDSVWMVERDGVQMVSIQADGLDSTKLAQLLLSAESMAVEDSKASQSEGKSRTDIGENNDVDASYQSIVVGVYKSPAEATAGLQKVSQWAPEAFVSNINGRYYVISSVVNNDIEAKNAKNIAFENGIDDPWSIQDKLIVTSLPNIKASPDLVVYFKFDDDNLQEKYQNQISQVIDALPADVRNVFMVGHTDSRGTRPYNNKLSIRRVQAVSEFISSTQPQFGESQILNHAGEENLQNECENGVECDEYAHFLNRRVEIWFY